MSIFVRFTYSGERRGKTAGLSRADCSEGRPTSALVNNRGGWQKGPQRNLDAIDREPWCRNSAPSTDRQVMAIRRRFISFQAATKVQSRIRQWRNASAANAASLWERVSEHAGSKRLEDAAGQDYSTKRWRDTDWRPSSTSFISTSKAP